MNYLQFFNQIILTKKFLFCNYALMQAQHKRLQPNQPDDINRVVLIYFIYIYENKKSLSLYTCILCSTTTNTIYTSKLRG